MMNYSYPQMDADGRRLDGELSTPHSPLSTALPALHCCSCGERPALVAENETAGPYWVGCLCGEEQTARASKEEAVEIWNTMNPNSKE